MSNKLDSNNPFFWYARCFRNYATFEGRARRKEFWSFALINMVVASTLLIVGSLLASNPFSLAAQAPSRIYLLVIFMPGLAVSVRRLHDIGRSGWWVLVQLVPYIGALVFLIMALLPGQRQGNRYGHDPKAATVDLSAMETVFS